MDANETVGTRGGAVLLPATGSRVKKYADLCEAVQTIAEGQQLALPPTRSARREAERVYGYA